jgi:CheY-like chemotaxis protein
VGSLEAHTGRPQTPLLLVDDDFDIRETLAEVLTDEGFEVTAACNGLEALRLLRAGFRPSVIVLDLMMPVMDGFRFRDEQRTEESLSHIPVVVITAGGSHHSRSIDAQEWVPKPVKLDRLLSAIRRQCCERPGPA